jgi:hypothetical protein
MVVSYALRVPCFVLVHLYELAWHVSGDKPGGVSRRTCGELCPAHCGGSAEADEEADVRKRKRGNISADEGVQKLALQRMVLST